MQYDLMLNILITLITVATFITPIYQTYFYTQGKKLYRKYETTDNRFIILLPIKKEPIEIVEKFLRNNREIIQKSIVTIIIADEYEYKHSIEIIRISRQYNINNLVIMLSKSSKNKAQALNKILKTIRYRDSTVVVVDVDSIMMSSIPKCSSVISPRWEGYSNIKSALSRGLEIGYKIFMRILDGIYLRTGWRPTLGSGLETRGQILTKLKLFNEDVILEDVEYSLRCYFNNIKIEYYSNYNIRVLVPSTYDALLKQQARWAYGSGELIRKYFKYLIRNPIILIYLLQYLSYPLQLILAIILCIFNILSIPVISLVQYIIVILIIFTVSSYTLSCLQELNSKNMSYIKNTLIAVNRVNMAYTVMSPRILISFILGLIGSSFRWIPTPKIEKILPLHIRVRHYLVELSISILLVTLLVLCIIFGNVFKVYMIDPLAFTISYVWGTFRTIQCELT